MVFDQGRAAFYPVAAIQVLHAIYHPHFRVVDVAADHAIHVAAAGFAGQRIFEAVDSLILYPLLGRAGRVVGTRELVISRTPYIAVYRVRGQVVEVLAVQHTARVWPDRFN